MMATKGLRAGVGIWSHHIFLILRVERKWVGLQMYSGQGALPGVLAGKATLIPLWICNNLGPNCPSPPPYSMGRGAQRECDTGGAAVQTLIPAVSEEAASAPQGTRRDLRCPARILLTQESLLSSRRNALPCWL